MKNKIYIVLIILLGFILAGCGKSENKDEILGQSEKTEYQDIMTEIQYFPSAEKIKESFESDGKKHYLRFLGIQFKDDEPVQLWGDRDSDSLYKIYLCRIDGSRELLVEGIPSNYVINYNDWYMDHEGCFYCRSGFSDQEVILVKLNAQGEQLYEIERGDYFPNAISELTEAPDEGIYVTFYRNEGVLKEVAELDPATGAVTVLDYVDLTAISNTYMSGSLHLGTGKDGPAICSPVAIREVDKEKKGMTDILLFNGTSYEPHSRGGGRDSQSIKNFRVAKDGSFELLWSDIDGSNAYCERLRLETIQRIPIVLCAPIIDSNMKDFISRFNKENDTYYIVIEEFGLSDNYGEAGYMNALEDYARLVSIQIATGKGPDIIMGEEILGDNISDLIAKGALENLAPYMEKDGIFEKDYLPVTFSRWREGDSIYSICTNVGAYIQVKDRNILGEEPEITEWIDYLLSRQENAVYMENTGCEELLRILLEGSENLWGMIDWEAGSCDFSSGMLENLLKIAKRYGDDPTKNYPAIVKKVGCWIFLHNPSQSEMEENGIDMAGWMFDDGCHALIKSIPIVINANSSQKEGAWEFLRFLLGDEVQEELFPDAPVKIKAFENNKERFFSQLTDYWHIYIHHDAVVDGEWVLTERGYWSEDKEFLEKEKMPSFIKLLTEARYLPFRTAPLLDIICEEAESYFNGIKSTEEVVEVIENRVRLYLDERK